jgi:hypothetical protein
MTVAQLLPHIHQTLRVTPAMKGGVTERLRTSVPPLMGVGVEILFAGLQFIAFRLT